MLLEIALILYTVTSLFVFSALASYGITAFSDHDYGNPFEYDVPVFAMWYAFPWAVLTIIFASIASSDEEQDEELINSYIFHKYRDTQKFLD